MALAFQFLPFSRVVEIEYIPTPLNNTEGFYTPPESGPVPPVEPPPPIDPSPDTSVEIAAYTGVALEAYTGASLFAH